MEASFVACTSCDFVTDCDGKYRDHERKIQIYSKDGVMMYDEKFLRKQ
ncbi:hypothetical protein [Lachnospira eligens]|nr:hypothetical protein [Lachnospira eligens]